MSNKFDGFVKKTVNHFKNSEKPLLNELTITVFSQRQINIIGYDKILKFDDYVLMVSCKNKILKVEGSNLVLSEMVRNSLVVDGTINSVEFVKQRS